jgi:prepilin-type processing-associated H-X9-DG protein
VGQAVPGPVSDPGYWYDDLGWYAMILPYIEAKPIYDSINFDISYSGPRNSTARRTRINAFGCPSSGQIPNEFDSANASDWARYRGNYAANFGNTNYGQTATDRSGNTNGNYTYPPGVTVGRFQGAPFTFRQSMRFADLTDGTHSTLLLAEVIPPDSTGQNSWFGPIAETQISVGGQSFQGSLTPNSKIFDQVARSCPPTAYLNGLPGCTLIAAEDVSNPLNPNPMTLAQIFAARSKHPGGVDAAMADGSVKFFKNTISAQVWSALSSARGNESISESDF